MICDFCPEIHSIDQFPPELWQCDVSQLEQFLSDLTLIRIPGKRQPPLLVSILLHGNEATGWTAIRHLLQHYQGQDLPREMVLLIGNVKAAAAGVRHLSDQPDFNRIWMAGETPEHQKAQQLLNVLSQQAWFAAIDIHNNTGRNPHYAGVTRLDPLSLQLATLFRSLVIYFTLPKGVLTQAMSEFCPAVVLECGKSDYLHGVNEALRFLQDCLHLDHIPNRPVLPQDIDLFHTVARVMIPPDVSFCFGDSWEQETATTDICFLPNLDELNFLELAPHTALGRIRNGKYLEVRNNSGAEVYDQYFHTHSEQLLTKVPFMPSMLTLNSMVIRQDCLGYVMERYPGV